MKQIICIIMILAFICGCSSLSDSVAPSEPISALAIYRFPQENRWNWNIGLYRVSEDHTTIERIPNRGADWHVNANKFVEPPHCAHCLMIGKPQIQGDGTIKVQVIISHPFPNSPEYTGFDVRGTIMFPATRYWEKKPMEMAYKPGEPLFDDYVPLYFSRSEDGGGQLLNSDGYTIYFFPGLKLGPVDIPIFNYYKGKYAHGPDPDSTVNGYKLFTNDPERRMFLVTDTISRTYHIAPPEGEFIFGYVVDASWAPPDVKPVTDPANDFPYWANCEDGYVLELEQLNPFKLGTYVEPMVMPEVTRSVVLTHAFKVNNMESYLLCPDIIADPYRKPYGIAYINYGTEEWLDGDPRKRIQVQKTLPGTYEASPGEYLALLYVHIAYGGDYKDVPVQLKSTIFLDFIYLEVVAGD